MAEFAQRPMVAQGMPPSAPNAVGTGITSGLVPENNDPIIQQGMEQFASSVDGLYGKLDQAESMEDVMNSVRGDEQTMKTRVDELADLVGPKDAKKTPESVLAVMQPYFQILEMVQSQASDAAPGGIADAPMAGGRQANVNFNQASPIQAPGSDEAAMRISMGETPVYFKHGGWHPGKAARMPSYTNTPFPTYTMPDYDKYVMPQAEAFMGLQKKLGYEEAPTDVATIMANQNKFVDEFKVEPRSREQILAEQQGFFGDQDQKDMETQGSLGLAKFGAQIANTPGSLLQAITANTPSLAEDMSKIAARKAALDRQGREFAATTAATEERELRSTNFALALDAVKTAAANGKLNQAQKNAAIDAGMKFGIVNAQQAADLVNKEASEAFNAQMIFAGKEEEIYYKKDAQGKYTSIRVRPGPQGQGLMMINEDSPLELLPIPEGYRPISGADHLAQTQAGGTDWSKAQKTTFTIPSQTSPDGWQQVSGVFVPNDGYYLTPDGGYATAVRPPAGSIIGSKSEVVQVTPTPDSAGRIFTTVTPPNGAAFSYVSQLQRLNDKGELVSINIEKPAYSLNKAEYTTNDAGQRVYQGGNPLVFERPKVGVAFEQMSQEQILSSRGKMEAHVYTLEAGEQLLAEIRNAIGPVATLKNLSNNLAGFLPAGDLKKLAQHFETEQAREALLLFERTIQKSENLSDRYAVAEQKIIAETAPKLSFIKDPEVAMAGFQKYLNRVQNMLADERHSLDPSKPRLALDLVPTGTEKDPFKFFDESLPAGPTSHFDFLTMMASDVTRPIDLSNVNVSITGKQLRYLMRNSTVPNKAGAYTNQDGSIKDNILVNGKVIIDLTGP